MTTPDETARLAQEHGIEVLGVYLSAAGYMLDFRYRVVDPEKATLLTNPEVKPYLTNQTTGARMYVPNPPKVGPLRQKPHRLPPGRTFFVLFANPGRSVTAGSKVTVVFGDCAFRDLIVDDPASPQSMPAHVCLERHASH